MSTQQFSSWVHGSAGVAESADVEELKQGFGTTFTIPVPPFIEPHHQSQVLFHYVHFPIPTPVIMGNSGRLTLSKVLILFNAVGGVNLAGFTSLMVAS